LWGNRLCANCGKLI